MSKTFLRSASPVLSLSTAAALLSLVPAALPCHARPAAQPPPPAAAAPVAPTDPLLKPSPKTDPATAAHGFWGANNPSAWKDFHTNFVAEAKKGKAKVVFLGDSITRGWDGAGKAEWEKRFAPLGAVNFGIGGDRTQQVLWRIENGTLDGLDPKLIVLKIGVNNLWADVNEYGRDKVAAGIAQVVTALRAKAPKAKILVLGILPAMEKPDHPMRAHAAAINELTAKLDNGKNVRYRDVGAVFVRPDGTISKEIMPDFVHLSPEGYRLFADAIEPTMKEMLR